MGIKGLQWFMRKHHIDRLEYQSVEGPLVIDGCGIMYDLYRECEIDWRLGGRYSIFEKKVIDFFESLANSKIIPVVVIDGLDLDGMKFDTLCERKRDSIRAINEGLISRSQDIKKLIAPPFMMEVFLEAVRVVGCAELIFADGEADPVVMQTANERQCPVLANDTDFFIFPLPEGFILYDKELFRYNRKSSRYEAKVFRQIDFVRQWLARPPGPGEAQVSRSGVNVDLCLVIPAVIGNDFLKPGNIISSDMLPSYRDCIICGGKDNAVSRIHATVNYIARQYVRSLGQFQKSCTDENTLQNITKCKSIYSCKRQESYAAVIEKIPKGILQLHRCGKLPLYITQALVSSQVVIKVPTDSPFEQNSSVLSSRAIRQGIYSLVGLPVVTEFFPKGGDLANEKVQAKHLSSQSISINDFLVQVLEINTATNAVFQRPAFKDWYLVAASLQYWLKRKVRSETHAKALVLCMVDCYHSDITNDGTCLPQFSDEWISALHVFSEWQFIYHDLCVANTLVGSPLHETSPCKLYDGHKAILYSLRSELCSSAWRRHAATANHHTLLEYLSSVYHSVLSAEGNGGMSASRVRLQSSSKGLSPIQDDYSKLRTEIGAISSSSGRFVEISTTTSRPPRPGGHSSSGYRPEGHSSSGYRPEGHSSSGYRPEGHSSSGYRPEGHSSSGYRPGGHSSSGYRPGGHSSSGYRPEGHSSSGYRPGGHRSSGYRPGGHSSSGYRPGGHSSSGYRPGGHSSSGYRPEGHRSSVHGPGGLHGYPSSDKDEY